MRIIIRVRVKRWLQLKRVELPSVKNSWIKQKVTVKPSITYYDGISKRTHQLSQCSIFPHRTALVEGQMYPHREGFSLPTKAQTKGRSFLFYGPGDKRRREKGKFWVWKSTEIKVEKLFSSFPHFPSLEDFTRDIWERFLQKTLRKGASPEGGGNGDAWARNGDTGRTWLTRGIWVLNWNSLQRL